MSKMSKEEIEKRLNTMSEDIFNTGYLAGLKSILPFVQDIKESMTRLSTNIEEHLVKNDPSYKKDASPEELAKETQQATEQLRELKENENS